MTHDPKGETPCGNASLTSSGRPSAGGDRTGHGWPSPLNPAPRAGGLAFDVVRDDLARKFAQIRAVFEQHRPLIDPASVPTAEGHMGVLLADEGLASVRADVESALATLERLGARAHLAASFTLPETPPPPVFPTVRPAIPLPCDCRTCRPRVSG